VLNVIVVENAKGNKGYPVTTMPLPLSPLFERSNGGAQAQRARASPVAVAATAARSPAARPPGNLGATSSTLPCPYLLRPAVWMHASIGVNNGAAVFQALCWVHD
jgi:hypothetical protein